MKKLEIKVGEKYNFELLNGDKPQVGEIIDINEKECVIRNSKGTEYSGKAVVRYNTDLENKSMIPVICFDGCFTIIKTEEKIKEYAK